MKLRNKQTLKVYTVRKDIFVSVIDTGKIEVRVMTPDGHVSFFYSSFNKMLKDWEDYKPAEPLIKDPKIRKAVRAWAEANNSTEIVFDGFHLASDVHGNDIEFSNCWAENINHGEWYTITELCGSEE